MSAGQMNSQWAVSVCTWLQKLGQSDLFPPSSHSTAQISVCHTDKAQQDAKEDILTLRGGKY